MHNVTARGYGLACATGSTQQAATARLCKQPQQLTTQTNTKANVGAWVLSALCKQRQALLRRQRKRMQNPVGNELLRPLDAGNRPRIEKILAAEAPLWRTQDPAKSAVQSQTVPQPHAIGSPPPGSAEQTALGYKGAEVNKSLATETGWNELSNQSSPKGEHCPEHFFWRAWAAILGSKYRSC